MSCKVVYKDISPVAKLTCTIASEDIVNWLDINQLNRDSGNFRNYSSCEHNRRILDGKNFEMNYEGDFGFWSKQMSNDDCLFDVNPVITFTFSTLISFVGLTLTFDTAGGDFATEFNIKCYQDDALISDIDYVNSDIRIFTNNQIQNTNKIIIEFKKTNLPRRYLKLNLIDYGVIRNFEGTELMDVQVHEEVSLLSTEVSVNTMDFTFKSDSDINFMFQKKQPLECYFRDELIGIFFIEKAVQHSKEIWAIENSDYIGVLDRFSYTGGIFNNVLASAILHDILDAWNIPFELDESFNDIALTGYLPIASARECVQQVLFACGCVADTSRTPTIKMYAYDSIVDYDLGSRIMQNSTFTTNEKVTEVRLTQFDYVLQSDSTVVIAEGNIVGTVEITFSEPYANLTLTSGTITKSGANYAIIESEGAYVLSGNPYKVNTTIISKKNPNVNLLDLQNVVEVSNATLVSVSNSADILDKLYDYCMRMKVANFKVPNDYISVGDYVRFESDYLGVKHGHVLSNTFNLNSRHIVADMEVLEDATE